MRLLSISILSAILAVITVQAYDYNVNSLHPYNQIELHRNALHNFVDMIAHHKDAVKKGIDNHVAKAVTGYDLDDIDDDGTPITPMHLLNPKPHLELMDIISHGKGDNEKTRGFGGFGKLFAKMIGKQIGKHATSRLRGDRNRGVFPLLWTNPQNYVPQQPPALGEQNRFWSQIPTIGSNLRSYPFQMPPGYMFPQLLAHQNQGYQSNAEKNRFFGAILSGLGSLLG